MSLAPSPKDPNMFITGSVDRTAKVWDIRTGRYTHSFKAHSSDIDSVAFFPNGHSFVTGSDDCTCKVFDIRAYKEINSFTSESIVVGCNSVDLSESGRLLFAAYGTDQEESNVNKVCIWDTLCYGEKPVNLSVGPRISCVAVNHGSNEFNGGSALCTGGWDSQIKLWS